MTKKLTNLLLLTALILTLSACSNDSKTADAQAEANTTQSTEDLQAQIKELKIENSKLKTENAKLLKKMQHQQKQTTKTNNNDND
ncbi:hypothetical protein [Sutcliffiella horikoshii]|uniref:hypothetical protein n=1 Tax=Sutcliffiella horikoshii TaxID=79883 RepID=UPI00384FB68B